VASRFALRRLGRRLIAEVVEEPSQAVHALRFHGCLQPDFDQLVDLGRASGPGIPAQGGQPGLHPAIAAHQKRAVHRLHGPLRLVQLGELHVLLQGGLPLADLLQARRHQAQVGGPLRGVVQQFLDLGGRTAIGGEVVSQAVEQRVAKQFPRARIGVQFIGPAETGYGLGVLALVHKHFATKAHGLGVVGISGESLADFLTRGVDLVERVHRVQALGDHLALIAHQVARHVALARLGDVRLLSRVKVHGDDLRAAQGNIIRVARVEPAPRDRGPLGQADLAVVPGGLAISQPDTADLAPAHNHQHALVNTGDVQVLLPAGRGFPSRFAVH
jgi:hypothetical protein